MENVENVEEENNNPEKIGKLKKSEIPEKTGNPEVVQDECGKSRKRLCSYNQLVGKHYLGVFARAAWFAYLAPVDSDELYENWHTKRDIWSEIGGLSSSTTDMSDRDIAFGDFISLLKSKPTYIHSPIEDTDAYLIETIDNELWIVWRGTQATLEDGFSLRDLYADVRFRLTQCPFLPGRKTRLHAGFSGKYECMRSRIFSAVGSKALSQRGVLDKSKPLEIRCIGHSLGGALAMLCAVDLANSIAKDWGSKIQVSCITFGAPAAGNATFANVFNDLVHESVRITIEDDPIPYLPPFPWFSHVKGELSIRPCRSQTQKIASTSIKGLMNHHMGAYIAHCDSYDGKRIPLHTPHSLYIISEAIMKTIFIYGIILIILHMDKFTILTYFIYVVIDLFQNHFQSIQRYFMFEDGAINLVM